MTGNRKGKLGGCLALKMSFLNSIRSMSEEFYIYKKELVIGMLWSDVRELYPSQFVYLEDLQSHMEDGKLCVEG